ncbi:MAG TPA: hypothetical protein VFP95_04565, partial [Gammaproteobacteria bacterium]|nr:hypothetical protein [Gammaproteobacteria bacterium]
QCAQAGIHLYWPKTALCQQIAEKSGVSQCTSFMVCMGNSAKMGSRLRGNDEEIFIPDNSGERRNPVLKDGFRLSPE